MTPRNALLTVKEDEVRWTLWSGQSAAVGRWRAAGLLCDLR